METENEMKALYVVVSAGHTDEIMDILRAGGVSGGTIIGARGEGSHHRSFMGITLDYEQEIIISIADKKTAEQIMIDIQEKAGWKTEVRGICYMMPVDKIIGLRSQEKE